MKRVLATRTCFDLAHLAGLSDAPSLILQVSERTFYLLLNLAVADIADPQRYAVALSPEHYVAVKEADPEYDLFKDVFRAAQLEVQEMPNLEEWLAQLDKRAGPISATSLEETGSSPSGGTTILNVGPVPANELWLVSQITSEKVSGTFATLYHELVRTYGEDQKQIIDQQYTPLAENPFQLLQGAWFLHAGDYIRTTWLSCSAGFSAKLTVAYATYVMPIED